MANKYFVIFDPYYALIRAEDKSQATDEYLTVVAGSDETRGDIEANMVEIDEKIALEKFMKSPSDGLEEYGLPTHEAYLEQANPLVLLIDGSAV